METWELTIADELRLPWEEQDIIRMMSGVRLVDKDSDDALREWVSWLRIFHNITVCSGMVMSSAKTLICKFMKLSNWRLVEKGKEIVQQNFGKNM